MLLYMHSCRIGCGQREAYLQRPNLPVQKDREDREDRPRLVSPLAPPVLVPPFRQVDRQRPLLPLVLGGLDRSPPSKERTQL
jgi:hypothetical protein